MSVTTSWQQLSMRPTRRTIWCCRRCEVPGGPLPDGSRRYWRLFELNSLVSSRDLRPGARSSNSADWAGLRQPWSGRWKGAGRREHGGLPAGRQGPHGERSGGTRLGKPARLVALTLRRTGPRPQTHRSMCAQGVTGNDGHSPLSITFDRTRQTRDCERARNRIGGEVAGSVSWHRPHFSWWGNG